MPKWLLPEHIADVLPAEARRIEDLRRTLLDRYRSYGYELVIPPLLEYLDSLFTGTGHDLDLRTFKLVDQLSGKTMGVRADFTPQVARIDAHLLNRKGVVRLCYSGSVLHTLPRDMHATREPLQVGAELYGHPGIEADIEVAELALASAAAGGNRDVRIDLSHMGVLRALLGQAQLGADQAEALVALVRAKDVPSLREFAGIDDRVREALIVLCGLYGGPEVIDEARRALPRLPDLEAALDALASLVQHLRDRTERHRAQDEDEESEVGRRDEDPEEVEADPRLSRRALDGHFGCTDDSPDQPVSRHVCLHRNDG